MPWGNQFVAVTLVNDRAHQIPGPHGASSEFIKRKSQIALALIRSVVEDNDNRWNALLIPRETNETLSKPDSRVDLVARGIPMLAQVNSRLPRSENWPR
jgi:hypothetical protein